MRDVLMIALMVGAIALFAAYVAFCDRVVGVAEPVDSPVGTPVDPVGQPVA